jgi:MYXO-CTERM domain-containing protein
MMVGHGPPNYIYHHCADIEIVADPPDAGMIVDTGIDTGVDAGMAAIDTGFDDTGAPIEDAAVIDAQPPPVDGGPIADSGPIPDSGPLIKLDASTVDDAGVTSPPLPGLSTTGKIVGSCGCSVTDREGGSTMIAALLLAVLLARRRFRNRRVR